MGGDVYVGHGPQGRIGGQGLLLEHVEARAGQGAVPQRFDHVLGADDAAPGHVHQERAFLDLLEGLLVQHVERLIRQGDGEDDKVGFPQQGLDGISALDRELPVNELVSFYRGQVVGDDVHPEGFEPVGQVLSVVAQPYDAHGPAVQAPPGLHPIHAPLAFFLGSQELPGVIAALQHEVDAVLGQHRGAAAGGARDGNAPGKNLGTGRTVQARMVAEDPFERVLPQQNGVHVAHQDGHVRVPSLLFKSVLVIEGYIDELGLREHPAQVIHVLFVVPNGRHDLADLRHGAKLPPCTFLYYPMIPAF